MFIKELETALKDLGVTIELPYISERIGITLPHQQFTFGKDVPASELAQKIRDFASIIQFVPVQLPAKGVEFSCLYRIENIFVRYLEAITIRSDEIEGRYDVIVVKY